MIRESLKIYIYNEVIPGYAVFDKAHREDHALTVIERALSMGKQYDINEPPPGTPDIHPKPAGETMITV